jgi:HD-GYP domain-containing protein (c-di-GMP phosphodiesterase class II)
MGVDKHYLATAMVPGMNARLLVHQPVAGLISAGEAATGGLLWISLGIGSVVLLSTGFTTVGLMRRHDRDLEAINTGLEAEVARRLDQAMATRDALILGLAKLADYRDTDTGTHLERIAEYSELLARELARADATIDEAYIRRLRVASSMHDIGKVGVEDAVLLKPGKLTDAERGRMQRHPIMGADTLIAIREKMGHDELVEMALVVTLEHHERWDGKGYPLGLAGEQIQLPARIVALADVYDALTSKRVYKDAMTHEAAAAVIVQGRGTQFDPMVVDAFMACGGCFARARERLQPPASNQTFAPRAA